MNEQVKQRLVGAVVLVSLAVIFIPMLLDGGDDSSMSRFGSNIPQQPDFDFEPLDIPLQPAEPAVVDRPRVIDKAETQEPVPDEAGLKPVETSKPISENGSKPVEESTGKPAANNNPITWVVQVGSFSQSANALALRDKLRKNGFTAFVEKYRDKGKTSYRVRVGPELKRETAEKQVELLETKMKLKGIVMGHP